MPFNCGAIVATYGEFVLNPHSRIHSDETQTSRNFTLWGRTVSTVVVDSSTSSRRTLIFSHLRKFILALSVGLRSAPRLLTETAARKLAAVEPPMVLRLIVGGTVFECVGTVATQIVEACFVLARVVVAALSVVVVLQPGRRARVATGEVRPAPRLGRRRARGLPGVLARSITPGTTVEPLAGIILAEAHVLGVRRPANTTKQGLETARPAPGVGRPEENVTPGGAGPPSGPIVGAGAPGVTPLGQGRRSGRPGRVGAQVQVHTRVEPVHGPRGGRRLRVTPLTRKTPTGAWQIVSEEIAPREVRPDEPVTRVLATSVLKRVATIVRPSLGRPAGRLAGRPVVSHATTPVTGRIHAKVVAVVRPIKAEPPPTPWLVVRRALPTFRLPVGPEQTEVAHGASPTTPTAAPATGVPTKVAGEVLGVVPIARLRADERPGRTVETVVPTPTLLPRGVPVRVVVTMRPTRVPTRQVLPRSTRGGLVPRAAAGIIGLKEGARAVAPPSQAALVVRPRLAAVPTVERATCPRVEAGADAAAQRQIDVTPGGPVALRPRAAHRSGRAVVP